MKEDIERKLRERHESFLQRQYPHYRADVRAAWFENDLKQLRAKRCMFCGRVGRPRVLTGEARSICEQHRSGTPRGRRLTRLISSAGGVAPLRREVRERERKILKVLDKDRAIEVLNGSDPGDITLSFWLCLADLYGRNELIKTAARISAWTETKSSFRAAAVQRRRKGGAEGGRPRIAESRIDLARKEIMPGATLSDAARRAGVSRTTLWRYLNRSRKP